MTLEVASLPSRIVCGIDLEGRAQHAAVAALWLAERLSLPLEFVHAFPPPPTLWSDEARMPEWMAGTASAEQAARAALREAVAGASKQLALRTPVENLHLALRTGHPVQVLLDFARSAHAGLIVLGRHARRNRLDLGNTARGVLAHAQAVWVQPEAARPVRRILAAMDASPDSQRVLQMSRSLATAFQAQVTAVRAFTPPILGAWTPVDVTSGPKYVLEDLRRGELKEFEAEIETFDWQSVPHRTVFEERDPAGLVLEMQAEHDLIVMGTHGRTALMAALLGSVAQAVLRGAHVPVLALRVPSRAYLI
jgi:nucleotide-binding universal stress UspA family protein